MTRGEMVVERSFGKTRRQNWKEVEGRMVMNNE